MEQPKVRFIADILEEHFEEIQALWIQREAALQSPLHTLRTLSWLEERIEVHVSALLPRGDVVPALVSDALAGDSAADSFAAAYVLLRLGNDEQDRHVLEAFLTSDGGPRQGIRDALCHAPIGSLVPPLLEALAKASPGLAVAAAEVLAFHGQLDRSSEELAALLKDDDSAVRRDAWRVVSIVDTAPRKGNRGVVADVSAAPAIVSVTLKVESGPRNGKAITLRPGEVRRVGRSVSADLSIPHDPSIASVHFSIDCVESAARVRDLDSRTGITVNGKTIREARLADRDRIVAGDTSLVVLIERRGDHAVDESSQRPLAGTQARRPYEAALRDQDPLVRREALLAAAWTRQSWLLDHLRKCSSFRTPERWTELWLLAVLAGPTDLNRILLTAETTEMGPSRLHLLGTFGHPTVVDLLLREMKNADPQTAITAGAAFTAITGMEVDSIRRPPTFSSGGATGQFEEEFLADIRLPDPVRAEMQWGKVRKEYSRGTRWCRGINLGDRNGAEALAGLDLRARWEAHLRRRFGGYWDGSPIELMRFPRRRDCAVSDGGRQVGISIGLKSGRD